MSKKLIIFLAVLGLMLIFMVAYPLIWGRLPITPLEERALFVCTFLGMLSVFFGCLLIRNAIVSNSRIMLTQKKEYAALTKSFSDASRSLDITGNHMKANIGAQRETADALINLAAALLSIKDTQQNGKK